MRAHFLLPIVGLLLGVPCLASASGGGLHVRASLDEAQTTVAPPSPRRIRPSLDDQPAVAATATATPLTVGKAEFPISPALLTAAPRRLFRLTLDSEAPPPDSRLIRLSLEEGVAVYGRLRRSDAHGRYFRTSLD